MELQSLLLSVLSLSLCCCCCTCFVLGISETKTSWKEVWRPAHSVPAWAAVVRLVHWPCRGTPARILAHHTWQDSKRTNCLGTSDASPLATADSNSKSGSACATQRDRISSVREIPGTQPTPVQWPTGEVAAAEANPEKTGPQAAGDLECVEIDATVDGISRDGLLQLLQEMQQQMPELYRRLSFDKLSALEALPTEQLRGLLQQLLDLAEAADALKESSATGPPTDTHAQEEQEQLQPKPCATEQEHQHAQPQQSTAADVKPLQGPTARAAATAAAAASSAAVQAQELLDLGASGEEGSGMFAALQEQLPQLTDTDVWEMLVTMGPVLEALVSPEVPEKQQQHWQAHQQWQQEQQERSLDSLEQMLDATRAERQAMAAEAEAMCKFVEERAGPLSSEARRELVLALLAVVEAEDYSPTDPQVRRLLRLGPATVVTPSAAAGAAAGHETEEDGRSRGLGDPAMIAVWRRLLQQPENASAGEEALSPAEAAALSAEEVRLRYSRLLRQVRGDDIRASLERRPRAEPPEAEGPTENPDNKRLVEASGKQGGPRKLLQAEPPLRMHETMQPGAPQPKVITQDLPPDGTPLPPPPFPAASVPAAAAKSPAAVATVRGPAEACITRHMKSSGAIPAASAAPEGRKAGGQAVPGTTARKGPGAASLPLKEAVTRGFPEPEMIGKASSVASSQEPAAAGTPTNLSGGPARFGALGLSASVSSAAAAVLGGAASKPTETQRLAIPPLLRAFKEAQGECRKRMPGAKEIDRLVALRAETGSGKTLAFLLPIMQVLREQEEAAAAAAQRTTADAGSFADLLDCGALAEALREDRGPHSASIVPEGPRALVICPSRPLAAQVASAAASLAGRLRLSVGCTIGGVGDGTQRRMLLRRPVDILIGTPDRLLRMTRPCRGVEAEDPTGEGKDGRRSMEGLPSLENLQFCVLDEADALWLGGFREEVERLLSRSHFLRTAQPQEQKQRETKRAGPRVLITCTATPESGAEAGIREALGMPVSRFLAVSGGRAFPPLSQLRHEMMQVLGGDRFLLLQEQLRIHPDLRAKKALVFCNTVDSCRACCHHLQSAGLPAEVLHC